ncbi:MAG: precorrin-3B C(17)-methyltransferase [Desulfomonilaceae bacterium]|nr:precorrin-3B C(17)-methyltransferase [Desulfomonilaceae bacterium]
MKDNPRPEGEGQDSTKRGGKLFVVGIGPGGPLDRTHRAEQAVAESEVVVGYTRYLSLITDLTGGKELISSGMTKERERCRAAIEKARQGRIVALISSGDAGIYGMAGLAVEMAEVDGDAVPIEIVPGITAAGAAAAKLGAPLMLDFACISLSDLLVPWETIRQRLDAVASADLVVALYNPRSKKRTNQLEEAAKIFLKYRNGGTPVGIGTAVGTPDERITIATLDNFLHLDINMRSIVLIGNRSSRIVRGFFVTPRGYRVSVTQ